MTDIVRYVDLAADGTGDGTTQAHTGLTGAYASLALAEAAAQISFSNLVTGGNTITFYCAGTADTTAVSFSGWTTDATHGITIAGDPTAPDGDGKNNGNTFDAAFYHLQNVGAVATISLSVVEDYVTTDGLQFLMSATAGTSYCFRVGFGITATNNRIVVKNGRFRFDGVNAVTTNAISHGDTDTNYELYNNTIEGTQSGLCRGIDFNAGALSGTIIENTVIEGADIGFSANSSVGAAKNCVFINNGDDGDNLTNFTFTYCAGDDAEFDSGTGNIGLGNDAAAWDAIVEDYSIGDYRPVAAGALCDAGEGTGSLSTDINGTAWGTHDIGAFAFNAAGGTPKGGLALLGVGA